MVKSQFGETSWNAELNNNNFQKTKELYLKLEDGPNVVRIITAPYEYNVHNYKEDGDTGYGDKIMCSSFHGSCPLCDMGDKPKHRWLAGIISRKAQAYKILDLSITVVKAIQELSRDDDYGDPKKYDIDIKVNKQGGATGYYTVIPKPAKPLSANDVEIIQSVDTDELLRKVTPPSPEKVQERLNAVKARNAAKKTGNQNQGHQNSGHNRNNRSEVNLAEPDDADFTFPKVQM